MRIHVLYSACLLAILTPFTASAQSNLDIVVAGNNQFALDLYGQLAAVEDGNLFLSPFSISTALAMTYAGARGSTATEMADGLHFTLSPEQLHPAFGELITALNNDQRTSYELNVANRLWGQQGYGFLPEFLTITEQNYGAALAEVDYINQTEEARQTINQWVEDQTNQKIKDLLPPGSLSQDTRLVLTNAIYFNSTWKYEFDISLTETASFWMADSAPMDVPMMHQTSEYRFGAFEKFQMIELPYTNDELSMIALLPNEVDGLQDLEEWLTAETLNDSMNQLVTQEVDLSLPRFEITSQFGLRDVLMSLGIVDAFGSQADFSGMNGQRDLFVSEVVHKAYASVNEEGTEAAAATGVVVVTGLRPTFYADHPFLILIRDNLTQSILFLGRVEEPDVIPAESEFIPGDFDLDGDVDHQDFLAWQEGFGTLPGEEIPGNGDADGDGDVDGNDFLMWQIQFSNPSTATGVPEPNSLFLGLVFVAIWITSRIPRLSHAG
ncbi:MAG: serpin family protein [Pirellulales bacterium]|nr:serpin family protein [Pirellulales bacterium]